MRIFVPVYVLFFCMLSFAEEKQADSKSSMKVPLPPFSNGGILSLWYHDHKFILEEYGEFDLLNYNNVGFDMSRDSLSAYSWKLVAMGDFISKEVSYATLARVKKNDKGILLILFQWHDPSDSSKTHGVYYRTFIDKNKLLLRTKQSTTGAVDTLEISCGDLYNRCGKCYFDKEKGQMILDMADKADKNDN